MISLGKALFETIEISKEVMERRGSKFYIIWNNGWF
jgi:hypothetical protein